MISPRDYDAPSYSHPIVTTVLIGIAIALASLFAVSLAFLLWLLVA